MLENEDVLWRVFFCVNMNGDINDYNMKGKSNS